MIFIDSFFLLRTYHRNAKAQYLAHHDSLTSLPNRLLFSDRLQHAMSLGKRNQQKVAILFIDLDNLKMINDHFGHLAGDAVLKEASERMRSCIRDSDTLARVGDDEFIILLPTIEGEQDAITVGKKILQVMSSPIDFEGQALHSSASVGITVYPDHGLDENKLIDQ